MAKKILTLLILLILTFNCAQILRKGPNHETKLIHKARNKIAKCIRENVAEDYQGPIPVNSKIDSILINSDSLKLDIYLSRHFSHQPFRRQSVDQIYDLFKNCLGRKFRNYKLTIFALNEPIQLLVPNFYQPDSLKETARMPILTDRLMPPLVQNISKRRWQPTSGLFNKNIALWHSHGFYFTKNGDRWEWQRPRLFCTVEDLLPMSFTLPYLVPMLENAGANVFIPRERCLQTQEVVIDNDSATVFIGKGQYREFNPKSWRQGGIGFAIGHPPYPANLNPFLKGSYRVCQSDTTATAFVEWIPEIPVPGNYGVYVSFHASAENITDAHYTVYHLGGKTNFLVNQQIGGGTWQYLGEFQFKQGLNQKIGKVVLTNESESTGKIVSADAVRFGGGMGNIVRGDHVSGYPRFAEAARYFLQYAGMPDTLVYSLNQDTSDYKDDYQSRPEFVNFLRGKPFGPNVDRQAEGLGIPIDLSLAFHTDAGIDSNDNTIGTLSIYSVEDAETLRVFPDGMSRLANRDLADLVQTQIVDDIRLKYRADWARRALMNADYSEAYRPNVPGMLLELLSHQNFRDMQYALSPQFRFDVGRSIYKGMLKFIATQFRQKYVVQPLPVSHFATYFSDLAEVTLKWQPVLDPLEASAAPEKYVVYSQIGEFDFDNGTLVDSTKFTIKNLNSDVIYSFKITAVNAGGESFPSEVLSVCWQNGSQNPVLVVNGFDRVGPPDIILQPGFKGFAPFLDAGVPDKFDFNYTGMQFDFDPHSKWRTNDAPGHGASQANFETQIRTGNTFNYPLIHGKAIKNCGCAFVSASDEAVMDNQIDLINYKIVDLILGEEKTLNSPNVNIAYATQLNINCNYQVFPEKIQKKIKEYFDQGGNLFVSGSYVGTDLFDHKKVKPHDAIFAQVYLKFVWQTNHAAVNGKVFSVDSLLINPFEQIQFNTDTRPDIYSVESPDAIDPAEGAKTILRYAENRFSAATAYFGNYSVIVFGFPFETISGQQNRDKIMKAVLNSFKK